MRENPREAERICKMYLLHPLLLHFKGVEYQEKLKLEEQKRAAEHKYKYKRKQIRELQEDIQVALVLP